MRPGRTVALAALLLAALGCQPPASAPPTAGAASVGPTLDPVAVLRDWDRRRAEAYAAADAEALRAIYTSASSAGRRDVRLLRRYANRGLRVTAMQSQILEARVRSGRSDQLVLHVTDRLASGVAVGQGRRLPLPAGAPREQVLVLVRADAEWVMAAVHEDAADRELRGTLPP